MTLRIAVCDDDAAAAEWMRGQADEDALAEKTVTLWLIGTVVDGLRLGNLTV